MRDAHISFRKNPLFDTCPSCAKGNALHRSHTRNLKENIIKSFTFYSIYRCRACGWRGYRSTLTLSRKTLKSLLLYSLLAVAVSLIVLQVLKRVI